MSEIRVKFFCELDRESRLIQFKVDSQISRRKSELTEVPGADSNEIIGNFV